MRMDLESLVDRYDTGEISRRQLLCTLAALLVPTSPDTSAAPRIAEAKQLNHVTLYVKDFEQSRKFYQDLFGMPVLTQQPPGADFSRDTPGE